MRATVRTPLTIGISTMIAHTNQVAIGNVNFLPAGYLELWKR